MLAGDAAMHTNPALGRGVSLAALQAQHLADAIEGAAEHCAFAAALDRWTCDKFAPWFVSQVAADGQRIEQMAAALTGTARCAGRPAGPFDAMLALAATEPDVARRLNRHVHLLDPPDALDEPSLNQRVRSKLAEGLPPIAPALSRQDLVDLIG